MGDKRVGKTAKRDSNDKTSNRLLLGLHFSSPQEHGELVDVSGSLLDDGGEDGRRGSGSYLRHGEGRGRGVRVALLLAVSGKSGSEQE